jgi:hypothetical protein
MKFYATHLLTAGVTFVFAGLLTATPAAAQATRTWISGVGDDANPCSRTAPCKTFAGAISKTAATGEINCLDPGGFGGVTITKSITLSCEGVTAGILIAATNGITINAGPTDVVRLRGLDLEGLSTIGGALSGINVLNVGALYVTNVKINGFGGTGLAAGSLGYGISFTPGSDAVLVLDNVELARNGNSGSPGNSGGLLIKPAAGVTAKVSVSRSIIERSANVGIRADTTGAVGAIIAINVSESFLADNGAGVLAKAPAGTGTISLAVDNTTVTQNSGNGILANGSGATVRVGGSLISGNATGVQTLNAATISSYGNNHLNGNTTDGTFSGTIAPQ